MDKEILSIFNKVNTFDRWKAEDLKYIGRINYLRFSEPHGTKKCKGKQYRFERCYYELYKDKTKAWRFTYPAKKIHCWQFRLIDLYRKEVIIVQIMKDDNETTLRVGMNWCFTTEVEGFLDVLTVKDKTFQLDGMWSKEPPINILESRKGDRIPIKEAIA